MQSKLEPVACVCGVVAVHASLHSRLRREKNKGGDVGVGGGVF